MVKTFVILVETQQVLVIFFLVHHTLVSASLVIYVILEKMGCLPKSLEELNQDKIHHQMYTYMVQMIQAQVIMS